MRMRSKVALGTIVFVGWIVSGLSPAEAGGFNTCMNELLKQGVLDPATQCWPCRDNPDLPICQIQGSGARSGGNAGSSGEDSSGRSGSRGSGSGGDSSNPIVEGGPAQYDKYSADRCLQFSQSSGGGLTTIIVVNSCSQDWNVEDVCGRYGLVSYSGVRDMKVFGRSRNTLTCK